MSVRGKVFNVTLPIVEQSGSASNEQNGLPPPQIEYHRLALLICELTPLGSIGDFVPGAEAVTQLPNLREKLIPRFGHLLVCRSD